jgi:Domain of unknown function (DUF4157)
MSRARRRPSLSPDAQEQEARRAAEQAAGRSVRPPAGAAAERGPQTFDDVRLHRDGRAGQLTEALGTPAVTMGRNVFLSPAGPDPASDAGRRVLAHELTHVVQQRDSGERVQRFTTSERSLIASDLAAMMAVVQALVTASSSPSGDVSMDKLVTLAGGRTAGAALPGPLRSHGPGGPYMLTLRYLFTSRCGLVDMRHFCQLMYISWFTDFGNAQMAARGATRRGIEHELTSEAASKFGPEDLPSNALGAWTGTQLAGLPQRDDLIARVRETLERCGPVAFDTLSPASQMALVNYYAALGGTGEPVNQDPTVLPLIPAVPELTGTDRSFPFELDHEDPDKATISGPAFDAGAAGLTGDTEIRSFLTTQREQVLAAIPATEKVRLGTRLLQGWISDADIDAFELLYRISDSAARQGLRAAVADASVIRTVQRTRLQKIVSP